MEIICLITENLLLLSYDFFLMFMINSTRHKILPEILP